MRMCLFFGVFNKLFLFISSLSLLLYLLPGLAWMRNDSLGKKPPNYYLRDLVGDMEHQVVVIAEMRSCLLGSKLENILTHWSSNII